MREGNLLEVEFILLTLTISLSASALNEQRTHYSYSQTYLVSEIEHMAARRIDCELKVIGVPITSAVVKLSVFIQLNKQWGIRLLFNQLRDFQEDFA
jgi:hypothetical protein